VIRRLCTFVLPVVALLSVVSVVSQAQSQTLMTRHTRDVVQNKVAASAGRMPATQNMKIVFTLPLRNREELNSFLKDVYDPSSTSYRKFLTVEQFTQRFGPTREDYETVKAFAKQNGLHIRATSRNRLILQLSGSVANVEKALNIKMGLYQHPEENRKFFAPDREPTPNLSVRLWHVTGLDNYSLPKPLYQKREINSSEVISDATTGSCPSKSFCGSDMRAAYYGGSALTGAGQTLGLLEFFGTNIQDVNTYYTNAGQTRNTPVTLVSTDGASTDCNANQGCDDTEQTLDITQALGMAPNLDNLIVYVGDANTVDDAGIFNAMATADPLDAQLSSSWAWRPADVNVAEPFFLEFQAQGQNLFQASGDSGKWLAGNFVWPADDGLITTVGGTVLKTTGAGGGWASETGWSDSGGGISTNNIAIPSYQVNAAAGCTSCSKTKRNGPDVSANSDFSFYVCADQTTCTANNFGGTSFAAPMWAGFLALVNQQAAQNGQGPLGFINPTIYDIGLGSNYSADFHDSTSGNNGFACTAGFDLVTGFGSPTGQALIDDLAGVNSDFSLASTPKVVRVARGATGRAGIASTVSGGFSSSISLSASGQPAGVQVKFNPASITGAGRAVMMIRVGANAATGQSTITVTGSGGGKTHTTTITLVVQ